MSSDYLFCWHIYCLLFVLWINGKKLKNRLKNTSGRKYTVLKEWGTENHEQVLTWWRHNSSQIADMSTFELTSKGIVQFKASSLDTFVRPEGNKHCIAWWLNKGRNVLSAKSPQTLFTCFVAINYLQMISCTAMIVFQLKVKYFKTYHVSNWCGY